MKIYFSHNGGEDWDLVAITENDGKYNWDVPSINSKECLIKIENFAASLIGMSKKSFTIDGPEIKILSPAEEVVFSGGDKTKITWESKYLGNELINIYYSIDNGYNWHMISDRMVDTGFYIWDVPHLNDVFEDCLIKISTNSDKAVKISQNFTIINKTNKIRISFPNGGELLEAGSSATISWKANGLKSDLFKILFSNNGGYTWERIESRVLNTNEYFWSVPNIESENCKIKIIAVENEDIIDISEDNFTISKKPDLKISNPSSNSEYYFKESMAINWSTVNVRGKKVNIYYSIDKGKTWETIKRGISNNGFFNWDIPKIDTTSYFSKIKVELANNINIKDINNGFFTLYGIPELKLKSPEQSNLIIEDKTNYKIIWDSKNIRENRINLYYSVDSGLSWKPIAIDISNKGYHNWAIPNLKTTDCIFKIQSTVEPNVLSISDYSLKITERPLIVIDNKLNDLTFNLSDSILLSWQSYNLSDKYLDISYSIDSGKNWNIINENIIDSGSKTIKIPFVSKTSSNCKIKISDSNNLENFSNTSGLFTIVRPSGTFVLLDNKKKIYNYNERQIINWTHEYLYDKKGNLYYSLNGKKEWNFIDKIDVSDNQYNWEIPDLEYAYSDCYFKIDIEDASYNFIDSLGSYKINPAPFVTILNSEQDTVKTNMPFEIRVNVKNAINNDYNIYYSLTKGMNWTSIIQNIDSEKYFWNVPSIKGFKNVLIKTELNDDQNIIAIQNFPVLEQSINLTLLKPNGNEKYGIGDNVEIIWSVKKIYDKTIDLYYSLDNGLNWSPIELSAKNSGKYNWLINDGIESSNQCKIKVQSNINSNIFDITDGVFLIDGFKQAFNIMTPNGGDVLYKGSSTFIYWQSIIKNIDKVNIYYSYDNGENWSIIAKNIDNTGEYSWPIPKNIKSSNKCLIKITSSKNSRYIDTSNSVFRIK